MIPFQLKIIYEHYDIGMITKILFVFVFSFFIISRVAGQVDAMSQNQMYINGIAINLQCSSQI